MGKARATRTDAKVSITSSHAMVPFHAERKNDSPGHACTSARAGESITCECKKKSRVEEEASPESPRPGLGMGLSIHYSLHVFLQYAVSACIIHHTGLGQPRRCQGLCLETRIGQQPRWRVAAVPSIAVVGEPCSVYGNKGAWAMIGFTVRRQACF